MYTVLSTVWAYTVYCTLCYVHCSLCATVGGVLPIVALPWNCGQLTFCRLKEQDTALNTLTTLNTSEMHRMQQYTAYYKTMLFMILV